MSRGQIFHDIVAERNHQQERWGDTFDDGNSAADWQQFINNQFTRGFSYTGDLQEDQRKALINAAAIAVAAVEAFDRNDGLFVRR